LPQYLSIQVSHIERKAAFPDIRVNSFNSSRQFA
jgi:hypothetical protein